MLDSTGKTSCGSPSHEKVYSDQKTKPLCARVSQPSPGFLYGPLRLFQQLFQVARVVLAGSEGFFFQEPEVEGDRRLYTLEAVFAEGASGPADSFLSSKGPDYELAHHRVVERGDLVPLVDG